MVADAEKFASEDEAQRKKIEALNSLSSFVYGLKTQLDDQGLGGKISDNGKTSLLGTIKETTDWNDENGSEVQVVANPITSKLYSGSGSSSSDNDDEVTRDHDEL